LSENDKNPKTRPKHLVSSITIKPLEKADKVLTIGKFFLSLAIDLGVVLGVFYIVYYYLKLFPEYLKIPVGDNLLQILITANGVLLGFVGIIFAQLLSSTSDQQNVIYQKIIESQDSSMQSKLSELLHSLERKRIAIVLSTAVGFISFTSSILFSLSILAKDSLLQSTDTFSVFGLFFGPLFSMVVGITMVLLALALPGKPPLEKILSANKTDKSLSKEGNIEKATIDTDIVKQQAVLAEPENQKAVSNRLVDLIDVLFGVVVAVNFAMLLGSNALENLPKFEQVITVPNLSILVAYVAIILSWVGYHQMIEKNPYVLNRWGYMRFSLDVIIVFMYTVTMYSIKITPVYLASFVIIFVLYLVGGLTRNEEYKKRVSWSRGILKFTALFSLVLTGWFVWAILSANYPQLNVVPTMWISAILVLAVLALNLRYRYERAMKGYK
jgi:hypothetical protein